MAIYKEMTTIVPGWAKYCAVNKNGYIWIYDRGPVQQLGHWRLPWGKDGQSKGRAACIGKGPRPKDWTQELYDLVEK